MLELAVVTTEMVVVKDVELSTPGRLLLQFQLIIIIIMTSVTNILLQMSS